MTKAQAKGKAVQMHEPTEEEKKMQIARFLSTKREQFTLGILNSMLQNPNVVDDKLAVVDKAVAMADHLCEILFNIPKETAVAADKEGE